LKRSRLNDRRRKNRRKRVAFLPENEILLLAVAAKKSGIARDRIILAYRPVLARIASQYATIATPVEELIAVGIVGVPSDNGQTTNGLLYAIDKFDPTNGGIFSSFVIAPITWAISKYAEQQRPHNHLSLNAKINSDDDDDAGTWQDNIIAEVSDEERQLPALEALTEHERVVTARYAENLTLKELAFRYGVSIERIRQIEAKALAKLRAAA
jgi:RNA polymerase sigma factor (sigma-70 family)